MSSEKKYIEIIGAKAHNLKNIDVSIPRHKLVVITGISGSGKSSLAFDTIYAEGQRRYMETFSLYARQFIGKMERPDVDQITGLSPVISIEQKTAGWNPRSTVGTVTEIYDLLRLLFARIGKAYSHVTGKAMVQFSEVEIVEEVLRKFRDQKIIVLAPLIRGRKGHYRDLFDQLRKKGFARVRVDGKILELKKGLQTERFKTHDIDVVIDRLIAKGDRETRLGEAIGSALNLGEGIVHILDIANDEVSTYSKHLMDADSGIAYEEPSPNTFSFNSPYGACPSCNGLGKKSEIDLDLVLPDMSLTINQGGIAILGDPRENQTFKMLRKIVKRLGYDFSTPLEAFAKEDLDLILFGEKEQGKRRTKGYDILDLEQFGVMGTMNNWYKQSSSDNIRRKIEDFMHTIVCEECQGYRLKPSSLQFRLGNEHIGQLAAMDLLELKAWFDQIESKLDQRSNTIGAEVIKEIRTRLQFLLDVGLGYLSLNRPAKSLSGGESQRTRLANQIGSKLTGITYIMDEPSIGLHQRDNQRLITALKDLVEVGNSVIVVEHDEEIMLASDYIIDLGPGAGEMGGDIVAEGNPTNFEKCTDSLTSDYLFQRKKIEIPAKRRKGSGKFLELKGATGNNLQSVNLKIPLGTLTCVTGVSGSGKSSLITETLYPILRKHFYRAKKDALPYKSISGIEHIDKVIEIDQMPIGRSPRSNPVTYINVFTEIRKLYANIPESKIRGYKIGRFSFNVKGGRCEECQGGGMKVIEMNFLPDVYVNCPSCNGQRFNRETLEILYKGKSISDVLNMRVPEAVVFFEAIPKIYRKLKSLEDVGLGYVQLGQSSTTLSGGEAQRVKLAEELSKRDTGATLYILDEPTTGLHFEDIKRLLEVIQKLVDKGNTFVVIEHNLDVVKVADHIIDIGPEGGQFGGQIVASGTPEKVSKSKKSLTAHYLKQLLR